MRASCLPSAKQAVQASASSSISISSPSTMLTSSTRFHLSSRPNSDTAPPRRVSALCHVSPDEAPAAAPPQSRRSLLLSSAAAGLAAALLTEPLRALADEAAAAAAAAPSPSPSSTSSSDLFVPDLKELPLPEAYVELSRALIKSLRDAIDADISEADESKVRRKAEPAKANVREWTSRWGDGRARSVGGSASHSALTSALRELGGFYQKKGQRARLDRETAGKLLEELGEAERGLPAEKEKKKGLFSLP